MSTLKTIGRKARRLRRTIAKMDPKKVYRIYEGDQHITLTGRQWKEATKAPQQDTSLYPIDPPSPACIAVG